MSSLQRFSSLVLAVVAVVVVVVAGRFGDAEARIDTATPLTTPMHKVLLTQRGYIQFLRWAIPVPKIREFTFCLWIKSVNFTLKNTIFSYSHNETQRQISTWVSPYGRSVHLEIGNVEIFAIPVDMQEQRWYHLCQSWNSRDGQFALWLDARAVAHGYAKQMVGYVIPANGDLVVGQEYTDFDKGLEEGIEGAILGFNLLLASVFSQPSTIDLQPIYNRPLSSPISTTYAPVNTLSDELSKKKRRRVIRRISADSMLAGETIGEYLIRMTYEHCERGRASPFIDPSIMIVSWTRTPVKVFGGAIVKNALGTCGHFG